MISVAEAEARILAGVSPVAAGRIGLDEAAGRVLAAAVAAPRTHPPHDVSSMDGYAVRQADIAALPAMLEIVERIAAGAMPQLAIGAGQAARIFTGAVIPAGADTVVIQEDTRAEAKRVAVLEATALGRNIRRAGYDFRSGDGLAAAGARLTPQQVALFAAANVATVAAHRRPRVAILATGDELVPPGIAPEGAQIVASTGIALAAMLRGWGAEPIDLGIARDDPEEIRAKVAPGLDADVLVTLGGASVGDHDIVKPALGPLGLSVDFWKIAMRPGKPLMFGAIGSTRVLGLPGNPVSSLVCARLFLEPLVRVLGGESWRGHRLIEARLGAALGANDQRQDYVRATVEASQDGPIATALPLQDSGNLSGFARADGLILRAPHAPAAEIGAPIKLLPLASWL
ncbi:Molybdopterin molybdenumtransferase [Alphaproteobacteria bacterium SO-S41]|nr:Molybdopterin molybdenumtransferase [Alphaproteobacteria bacterium SO-S41]